MTRFLTYKSLGQNGRLGNQLWQIASTAGIAHQRGMCPRFPPWPYQPFFNVPGGFFVAASLVDSDDLGGGYFQELHYFAAIEVEVRAWFQPAPGVMERVRRDHPAVRAAGHTTAVHVRRGDYAALSEYFAVLPFGYYQRAAAHVRAEHPDTAFIVCSDDIAWCEEGPLRHALGNRILFRRDVASPAVAPHDQDDFFLMMACDRHIIANSTYSWWAAYLSNDPAVIYPSAWFGPNSRDIPWRRMIPDGWVEVDASS